MELKLSKKPKSKLIQAAGLNTGADAAMDVKTVFGLAPRAGFRRVESKTGASANAGPRNAATSVPAAVHKLRGKVVLPIFNVYGKFLTYTLKICPQRLFDPRERAQKPSKQPKNAHFQAQNKL
ncbi:MAG: hypothetical protein V4454_17300 [Pseudomonadota bacterium]